MIYGYKITILQTNITADYHQVKKFLIPVPDINEQNQAVQIIESRLSVCESIEQIVDTALVQADAMRQSILKQAFEGGVNP